MSTNDSTSAASPAPDQPTKPKRSTVERIIVQGGIGVLLIILLFEGTSYLRHGRAHSRLMDEFEKAEETDHRITRDIVEQIVGTREPDISKVVPATVGEERYDVYFYDGLLKRRELCIHYGIQGFDKGPGSEPEVREVTTNIPEEILAE